MSGGYDRERLRSRLRGVRLERIFRVIHRDYRSTPLHAVPVPSRFSDPRGCYAVLYASESVRSAEPLALIDLRGDGPVRVGAPSAAIHDGNRAAGRALSAAVHATVPDADGILFPSRFTGHACTAVFERAFGKLAALGVADLASHADFLDALDDYDIVLTEPPE